MTDDNDTFDAAAELKYLREVPAADLLANHYFVLAQWAAVHLASTPPDLSGSQLVIDVMAAMLDAGDQRMGPHATLYRTALAEIQQAFVRASATATHASSATESSAVSEPTPSVEDDPGETSHPVENDEGSGA